MRRPKLTDSELSQHLSHLPGWARDGDSLVKTYVFKDFVHAIKFVNKMAEYAETVDHHPGMDIRYNKVMVSLSTHDSGGITQNDIDTAVVANTFTDADSQ